MRKLTVKEIKEVVKSALGEPERPEKMKIKQKPFHDADLANATDWIKNFKLPKAFTTVK